MKNYFAKSIFVLVVLLLHQSLIYGQTRRYITTTGAGIKDGSNWENAYDGTQVQTAISESGVTEVWVAKGTYKPTSGTDRSIAFSMKNGVCIYGGFAGTESSIDQRIDFGNGGVNETILSGDINVEGDSTDNSYHVFYHPDGTNLDSTAILDGFSIQHGYGYNGTAWEAGGGINNVNSSPTLRNLFIAYNTSGDGGGICNDGSSPIIENVLIYKNTAEYEGGGIEDYNNSSSRLINVKITANNSQDGGGVYVSETSSPKMMNVLIASNSAERGGGIFLEGESSLILNNVTIYKNTAIYSGGGFYHYYSTLVLNNCIVWNNSANKAKDFYVDGATVPENTVTLNYSCYQDDTTNVKVVFGTFSATNNCIISNPKLVETGSDVVLKGISPCVNKGNNSYNTTTMDIRRQDRIQYSTIDMGSCEWTQGVDPDGVVYADASRPNDYGDGLSWATAKNTLQSAINSNDTNCEQIWVKAGTYKPTVEVSGIGDRFKAFQLKNNRVVYGGFSGTENPAIFDLESRDIQTNKTILSGDIGVESDSTDNCYHVFNNNISLNNTAVLDGFTITDGNANGTGVHANGGGIYNSSASTPLLRNILINNNTASNAGGGVCNYGNLNLLNAVISYNSADKGGGIYNESNPILTNVTICYNSANNGGGMYNYHWASPILNNCIVWGNSATSYGNEICHYGYEDESGTLTINYSCYRRRGAEDDDTYFDIVVNPDELITNNCITSSPKFANILEQDYRLRGNSPCINAGSNSYNSLAYDLRGQDRIQSTTIDMGAYEWTQSVDPGNTLIIYADASKPDDNGNGFSWTNAKKTLQNALDLTLTLEAEQLWVKTGTYKPTSDYGIGGGSRSYHFRMINGCAIYGGFAGTESSIDQRVNYLPGQENETILSGDIGAENDSSDNCYHVFYHPQGYELSSNSVMNGFTITGGNANGTDPHNSGGGLFNSTSPTLQHITFKNNYASIYGGGIFNYGGLSMDYITIRNNFAEFGGGMSNNSIITLSNIFIQNNTADSLGGGIHNESHLTLVNSIIANNSSNYRGGGIYNYYCSLTFQNATITNNSSNIGGGIYSFGESNLTVNNSIIWDNSATTSGNEFYLDGNVDEHGSASLNYSSYGNGTNDVYTGFHTFTPDAHCINTDPLFVGSSNNPEHPYSIQGVSPCADAGNDSYCSENFDIRGSGFARKSDKLSGSVGAIDMGAYEYKVGTDPMPVELISLSASVQGKEVTLTWQTATEVNNYSFEILRSAQNDKNESWEKIGFVEGHGNSNSPKDYSFVDDSPLAGVVKYKLKQIDFDGTFSYSEEVTVNNVLAKSFKLFEPYPNPFNPSTTIKYSIPTVTNVSLKIYDILGNEVANLVNEKKDAGEYEFNFNASNLASGIYFYKLQAGSFTQTKKLILVK